MEKLRLKLKQEKAKTLQSNNHVANKQEKYPKTYASHMFIITNLLILLLHWFRLACGIITWGWGHLFLRLLLGLLHLLGVCQR